VDFTSPDPVLAEAAELLGEQAALTLDTVVRDVVMAGTTVQRADGAAARVNITNTTHLLDASEVRKAVRTLHQNKVRKITSIIDPSVGQQTKPVAAGYVGIIGPQALYDLKNDLKFIPVHEYGDRSNLLPFEVGALDEVRFVMTQNNTIYTGAGATGVDVHATLILGADAFGVIMPQGVQNIVHGFGTNGDPLNQRMTSGWKAYFTAKILQDLAMVRIEHGVSA
jgi:N4-gp56 family major capsid protein